MFVSEMSDIHETAALVALLRRGDRLWHHYADLVEEAGSALAVLEGKFDDPAEPATLALFADEEPEPEANLDEIVREVEQWRSEGMRVLTVLDEEYPANLRTIHNRPPILFIHGEVTQRDETSIAVVGTRKPSAAGVATARAVAGAIAGHGYTVVSGLAEGIDTAAHEAALESGRRTIAVIGTGLRQFYPAKNKALQLRIAKEAAVVSQFWPDSPPTKTSFPMRNIVMSGFALATVVVEASGTSGAKMQARYALEHGRPVFLLSSLMEHTWAREYATRPGTNVVESGDEVLTHIERLTSFETLTA
jgi:DNA processing protein